MTPGSGDNDATEPKGVVDVDEAELLEEFVTLVERAEYWVGALGLALDAAYAMDSVSPEVSNGRLDEVVRLEASSQWQDWLWLRDHGGVTLVPCTCGQPIPGTSPCRNPSSGDE
jgi:hypothetical protein